MNNNKLHLIPILEKGQTYNAALSSIVLHKAEYFGVTIKEYQEDEKKILELQKKQQAEKDFAINKWEENEKNGWNERNLREEYKKDLQIYTELEVEIRTLREKYNDVNWCWQLIGKKLNPNYLSHNDTFSKGIYQIKNTGKQSVKFPEFLIGGGVSWIEAFHENVGPVGETPYGLCVQAYGVPEISRIEWTDIERNPITEKIGFNSKVILHIYTKALYGQELEIKLVDKNSFNPKNKTFSNVPVFKRQVNIKKLEKRDLDKNGVSGLLTKEGQTSKDEVTQEYYTQKIELEILVEEDWDMHNGTVLSIFPVIKCIENDTCLEIGEGEVLNVVSYGIPQTSPFEVSNKPVFTGTLETNVANFAHCRYDKIELKKQDKAGTVVLFNSSKNGRQRIKNYSCRNNCR